MCVHACTCVYVICTCAFVHICVCASTCVQCVPMHLYVVHACAHVCMCVHKCFVCDMCACMRTCVCMFIHVHMYAYVFVCMCVYVRVVCVCLLHRGKWEGHQVLLFSPPSTLCPPLAWRWQLFCLGARDWNPGLHARMARTHMHGATSSASNGLF